ncbi:telomere-binding protein CDC13 TDEL_0A00970 [Torulaspora delbrueckii]|uniref:Telomeric single stranded DNA binding POT1/Cdc13 domain-containing protein n=1 Tax=Torulaspora delbrueckii TaxID=4950 RepID=G8ZLD5_TORDE|nr:hypothetical protein TDEL_0A00970 [Torulaspora delbrueckii]CCE89429.1 hypothetical protein TDEL_0A00970 [Torulaspora delbrueckii]
MGLQYKYITSTAAYDEFPLESCVAIEFVALLTSISYERTHYLLELHNFADGNPDKMPFLVKVRCSDQFAEKLARMTISLMFQCLEIDLPDSILDEHTPLNDIHLESLCFVKCQCLYLSKESKYGVYLENIKPFNAASVMDLALNHKDGHIGKTIFNIMQNLIRMDTRFTSPFKFARLNNPPKDFRRLIEKLKANQPALVNNPLFTANRLNSAPAESQNEFNSQCMGSSGSFDTMGFDAVEESDSSVEPELTVRKKPRLAGSDIQPNTSMSMVLGTTVKLVGQIAGLFPVGPDAAGDFRLYFIPHDWPNAPHEPFVAGVNCLECFVERASPLYKLIDAVFDTPDAFHDILARANLVIDVERTEWHLHDNLHSSRWTLTHVDQQEELMNRIQTPNSKRDPLIEFKDLTLRGQEVKYVTMIGLLVSCSFENPSFVSMVFTDFTSNLDINQKFLFDRFLLDFDNKLDQESGFRVIMYANQFAIFDKQLRELYNDLSLRNMFMPNSGENVSHKGILCRMSLKLKLYNDKLNAIVRYCTPISTTTRLAYRDERLQLQNIRESALKILRQPSLNRFYDNFTVCFPLVQDRSVWRVSMKERRPVVPELRLNAEDEEMVTCTTGTEPRVVRDIAALNGSGPQAPENGTSSVHRVEGQLLLLQLKNGSVQLHVTNELITGNYVVPARILTLELPTSQAVQSFDQDCSDVLGEEFCFTVTRRNLPLLELNPTGKRLLVWCPIECSLPELRSQLRHSQSVKQEEQPT